MNTDNWITITTATGKKFDSDYAVTIPNPATAFTRVLNHSLQELVRIFEDPAELPLEEFPDFHTFAEAIDEKSAIKIILKS